MTPKEVHLIGIQASRAVDNHLISDFDVKNRDGRLWSRWTSMVIGAKDQRARMGTLTTPWKARLDELYAMPELKFIPDRFGDLLDQRGAEIIDIAKSTGKKIVMLWSGGIDSTSVLISLLKNLDSGDNDLLEVAMTTDSVIEHPQFFQRFISGRHRCVSVADIELNNDWFRHHMLLHGDPGDCVVGPTSVAFAPLVTDGRFNLPWRGNLDLIIDFFDRNKSVNRDPEFGKWYVERLSQNLETVDPENVTTISDWWWWHYFNFKWSTASIRPLLHLRNDRYKSPIDFEHQRDYAGYSFYNTEKIQQWSYSNLKNHFTQLHLGTPGIKRVVKDYIYEFDGNEDYRDRKIKVTSKAFDFERRIIKTGPLYYDKDLIGYYRWEPGVAEAAQELLESFRA